MIRTVKLAKINLTMQTGTIVRWLKKEGERVERDEPLLEVETDKAVNTVESFHAGYLKKILVPEGQEVPVDTLIAYIGEKEDAVPAEPPAELAREDGKAPAQAAARPGPGDGTGLHAAVLHTHEHLGRSSGDGPVPLLEVVHVGRGVDHS